jgi:hypothetical protein
MLCRCSGVTLLMLCCCSVDTQLRLCSPCVDPLLTLCWCSVDAILMLWWHSVDTMFTLCWRSDDPLLILSWQSVDTWLTQSFEDGQRACRIVIGLWRRPVLHVCITTIKSIDTYLTYQIKMYCHSFDTHFQKTVAMLYLEFGPLWQPICSVRVATTTSLSNSCSSNDQNDWHSVDANHENWARSVSCQLWPIKVVKQLMLNVCNKSPYGLTLMQRHTVSMLRCPSFSELARKWVNFCFMFHCGLHLIYDCLHPITTQITTDGRPIIIDALLTVMFWMDLRAFLSCLGW